MTSSKFKTILALSVASVALAACSGADDIASPGEGVIVVPAPAPAPAPAPTPGPTPGPTPTPVPATCPVNTTDAGTLQLSNAGGERRNCQLSGIYNTNVALPRIPGILYSLSGRVQIGTDIGGDGAAAGGTSASLTIDPGVTVFASAGLDFLVVNRGSRIFAEGTATQPIVFTARQNVVGNPTDTSDGLWGGIILLGRAPISDCIGGGTGGSATCQQQIEGSTGSFYGGALPADNSGRMRYVQIRYSGFEIATGNELQGLTTGGVGSGTTLEFIQVHNSSDDGIEFFGGRNNIRNLIVTGASDDSLDTDFGYKGFMQFVIAIQRAAAGDAIIESDTSGNNDALPRQDTRISNFTFIDRSTAGPNAVLLRGGTDYTLLNGIVISNNFCFDIDDAATVQAANGPLDEDGPPVFHSVVAQCTGAAVNPDDNATADRSQAAVTSLFTAGTNNNLAYTPTLTNVFVNGATETAVTPFAAATLGSFFTNTTYIGAVQGASDLWYRGWTCDSSYANFGSASPCTSLTGA